MNKFKKVLSSMLAVVMFFSVVSVPKQVLGADRINLTVLATSDLHGKIYPWEYATDLSQEWGLAKIATLISKERAIDPDLLLIDNGDTIESNMINLFNDEKVHPMIKGLNELKYDTWTLGNHEFNFGLDVLGRAISAFNGKTLSANITKEDGSTFVNPYFIKEIKGVKVGVIGLTAPHIPRWEASTPDHFKGLTFNDPLASAQKYVDILKNEENVDVIIGAFHLGKSGENYDPNLTDSVQIIAEKVKGIDAIIAGHAHDTLGTADKQVVFGDTIVLEPSSDGKFLGKLNIVLEKSGSGYKVVSKNTDLLSVKDVEPSKLILNEMKYVDTKSKEEAHKVVGKATGDFVPADTIKSIPEAQVKDTALMDLINEVQMYYGKADISAAAMFDTRSNLKAGELQFKDVALIYKYSNTLQSHKISGKNLKAYMEWSASYYNTQVEGDVTISFDSNIRAYNYDMFSGINYEIDITKPAGQRIINATINGKAISDDAEYVLAVNNYRVGTLQSLGLLPKDSNESLVFDSTTSPTPEMQRLIQTYISEKLSGVVTPKVDKNWKVVGVDSSSLEGYEEAIKLINSGIITIPKSEDGRTPNVASVNILKKATEEDIKNLTEAAGISKDLIVGENITLGNLYKQVAANAKTDVSKDDVDTSNSLKVSVLSFNDFHGALLETGEKDKNMGAAKLVQAINEIKKDTKNVIVVSAGDSFNGTAISNLLYGKPVTDMFKQMGLVASGVGNHEFDWGIDKIENWSKDMNAPFLAANVVEKDTKELVSWAKPYLIKEIDGVKVAFIGLATPESAYKTKPEIVKDLEFLSPVKTAEKYVPIVKSEGADVVILLTHLGSFQDKQGIVTLEDDAKGITKVKGVDALITAHSHQTVNGKLDGIPVVQAYYNGRTLARLDFYFNPQTKKLEKVEASLEELYKHKADFADDMNTAKIMADYKAKVAPILDEVIGKTVNDMPRSKEEQSVLGQWTSEVMQAEAKADIAVTNGGGIRTDLLAGNVTMGNMYEVMPFDNVLSTFNMTGAQIKEVFEHGIENKEIGWIQFSGVKVEYVKGAEVGNKVVKMTLLNGEEIKPEKVYKVVTNDFMATGGDGYSTFLKAEYLGDTVAIRDVMVSAIKKAGTLNYKPEKIAIAVSGTTTVDKTSKPAERKGEVIYIVQPGDVLWKIARKYNKTWKELQTYNNISNPSLIYTGQKILIPAS